MRAAQHTKIVSSDANYKQRKRQRKRKKKKKYRVRQSALTRANIVPWAARDEEKKKGRENLAQQNVWPASFIRRRWMKSSHYPGKYLPFSNRRETKRFSRLMIRLYVARFERNINWAVNSQRKKKEKKENDRSNFVYLSTKYNFLKKEGRRITTPSQLFFNLHHLSITTIAFSSLIKLYHPSFVEGIYVEVIELLEGWIETTARVVEKKF